MTLSEVRYRDKPGRGRVQGFRGYCHTAAAGDGELWDMENLTFDHYPALSPRPPRHLRSQKLTSPGGLLGGDKLAWVEDSGFYYDGIYRGQVTAGRKTLLRMGDYVLIFPDKKYYRLGRQGEAYLSLSALNSAVSSGTLSPGYGELYGVSQTVAGESVILLYYWDGAVWQRLRPEFGSLESRWTGSITLQDGELNGEGAAANSLYHSGVDWRDYFQPGDGVTVSGCTGQAANNKTPILREISADGHTLRFSENALTLNQGAAYTESNVTLSRTLPELEVLCVNENRLWGAKGKEIFASKMGDPFNFNVFDGLSDDSWSCRELGQGDFTGAVSYLGYPIFFKEQGIYKVFGSRPDNFQLADGSQLTGVAAGSGASLAVAGGTLYYLSPGGVMAYQGGVPESLAAAFGPVRYGSGVAGSDGVCYYISLLDEADSRQLFVYDSRYGLWRREDDTAALAWAAYGGSLYCLEQDGSLWATGSGSLTPPGVWAEETAVAWWAETADFTYDSPATKTLSRLQLRGELEVGSSLTVSAQWDSSGLWEQAVSLKATAKALLTVPIVPRRCDHVRFKLAGSGPARLYEWVAELRRQ